jgi:ribose/xylose/arabinose/galactoside ABC-type transport system permease subunit
LRVIAAARLALLIVLFAALFGYFSLHVPNFLGAYNIYSVVQNGVIIGILGVGESLVIISGGGGIDLSVGSMLSLSGMILGIMNIEWGLNIWLAVAGCILTGLLLGCLNGLLVSLVRIPPLIVTLATFYGYAAIALQLTNTRPLPDATQPNLPQSFPSEFIAIGNGNIQDIGWLSWFPKISGEGIPFQVVLSLSVWRGRQSACRPLFRDTCVGRAVLGLRCRGVVRRHRRRGAECLERQRDAQRGRRAQPAGDHHRRAGWRQHHRR